MIFSAHTMNKTLFSLLPAAVVALYAAVSCNQDKTISEYTDPVLEEKAIAVEILADYRLITYDRPIDVTTDSDFIDAEVEQSMIQSSLYRKGTATRAASINTSDTLKISEQIPFCADMKETTIIYQNGDSEYTQETDLDPDGNPLLSFHESELSLTHCIAKIEIKDGKVCTYNNRGELLSEQEVEIPDYSAFLAELEIAQKEAAAETKAGIKGHDINWLRNKMAAQYQTKSNLSESYKIYEKDGKVVLEQYVNNTRAVDGLTIRTYLSEDISKNYGYEQIENGAVKVRCTNTFSTVSTKSTRSSNVPIDGLSEENPVRTVVEELSYLYDGTPMIKVSDKEFKVNSIHYNIKK